MENSEMVHGFVWPCFPDGTPLEYGGAFIVDGAECFARKVETGWNRTMSGELFYTVFVYGDDADGAAHSWCSLMDGPYLEKPGEED